MAPGPANCGVMAPTLQSIGDAAGCDAGKVNAGCGGGGQVTASHGTANGNAECVSEGIDWDWQAGDG